MTTDIVNLPGLDLEGIQFWDIEIGDIITEKIFGGNPYSQLVMYMKYNELDKKKDREGLSDIEEARYMEYYGKLAQVNILRSIFNLWNL